MKAQSDFPSGQKHTGAGSPLFAGYYQKKSLLSDKNSPIFKIFSPLIRMGNWQRKPCGTVVYCSTSISGCLKLEKLPVSREFPWRRVRSALGRQPVSSVGGGATPQRFRSRPCAEGRSASSRTDNDSDKACQSRSGCRYEFHHAPSRTTAIADFRRRLPVRRRRSARRVTWTIRRSSGPRLLRSILPGSTPTTAPSTFEAKRTSEKTQMLAKSHKRTRQGCIIEAIAPC